MARRHPHATLIKKLLNWYRVQRRDLPWRSTKNPYRIWVSEIMLQRTQVETVKPYYARFLAAFPTLRQLADASLDDVLKCWEGLGYYARARQLHRAARQVVREFNGVMPDRKADLLKLPGIGLYSAGAIASIAFGRDEAALDGNAMRVLSRLFNVGDAIEKNPTQKRLWELAERLLPPGRAADFNQALMELGATACVAQTPRCSRCPLEKDCAARRLGLEKTLPVHIARKPRPQYHAAVGIIWRAGKILIAKRLEHGLLGGLWEFPGGKRKSGERWQACLKREVHEELGVEIRVGKRLAVVEHGYTHFKVTLYAFCCEYRSGTPRALGCSAFAWVAPADLDKYAFPAANRKILQAI
jgi:A/G-specific adenine glycosylase